MKPDVFLERLVGELSLIVDHVDLAMTTAPLNLDHISNLARIRESVDRIAHDMNRLGPNLGLYD